jgi:hypothetical protein
MPPRLAAAVLMMWSPSAGGAGCADTSSSVEPSMEERALGEWIEALAVAESGNRGWIVHQESDGRNYYGCLQFSEKTFRHFAKKYRLVQANEPEVFMNFIYDCSLQKRLAARMIRENPENWKHWRKSVERIGLPPGAKDPVAEPRESRRSVL